MSSLPGVSLLDLFDGASPETVTSFVAEFYEARGWTVDREGERRLVVSGDDRTTRVAVVHPADHLPRSDLVAWADTVVVLDEADGMAGDADVIDAATLQAQLAYAVERPVARRLLRSHFGWSSDEQGADDGDGSADAAGETPWRDGPHGAGGTGGSTLARFRSFVRRSDVLLATVVVVALVGSLAVVVGEDPDGEETAPDIAGTAVPDVPTPTPLVSSPSNVPSPVEPTPAEKRPSGTPVPNLPPGVNQSGEIDGEQLGYTHRAVLENKSYRLTLTYRERVGGRPAGVHTETIRVVNDTYYSVDVVRHGTLRTPVLLIATHDAYANGSVRFVRVNDSTIEREPAIPFDRYLTDQASYLSGGLDARESTVLNRTLNDGTWTFYIVTEEDPSSLTRNTTASIVVTEEGLVRSARWTYDIAGTWEGYDNISVTYSLRVSDIGTTTVQRPSWMNGTAG